MPSSSQTACEYSCICCPILIGYQYCYLLMKKIHVLLCGLIQSGNGFGSHCFILALFSILSVSSEYPSCLCSIFLFSCTCFVLKNYYLIKEFSNNQKKIFKEQWHGDQQLEISLRNRDLYFVRQVIDLVEQGIQKI